MEDEPLGSRQSAWSKFWWNRIALGGLLFLVAIVVVAVAAPLLAPHDPDSQDLLNTLDGPSAHHLLGTDLFGRDVLSRLIFGTRVSLLAGAEAVGIATALGVTLGLIAGYFEGWVEWFLTLLNDSFLSVPGLVLALAVVASLGAGLGPAMFAIGLVMMPRFYRLARASALSVKNEVFIRSSVSIGCTKRRVLGVHILPNALPPLIVEASFSLGTAIIAEASLSFLGLGVRPPTPSWGSMLADARQALDESTLLVLATGGALTLTVLAFTLAGDGVRDAIGVNRQDAR